jgi:hypothetical protein
MDRAVAEPRGVDSIAQRAGGCGLQENQREQLECERRHSTKTPVPAPFRAGRAVSRYKLSLIDQRVRG